MTSLLVMILTGCSEDFKSYQVQVDNALFVDNDQSIYQKGDLLWLNINIPKEQIDTKTGKTIDIYDLTDVYDAIFTFSLYSIGDTEFESVTLDFNNIEVNKGGIYLTDEVKLAVVAGYDYYNGVYDVRVGIPLKDIGNYFIANGLTGSGNFEISFSSENHEVHFSTNIKNADTEGRFHLTVNE